jgi:hypothetical protein
MQNAEARLEKSKTHEEMLDRLNSYQVCNTSEKKNNPTALTEATSARQKLHSVMTTEGILTRHVCWNHNRDRQKQKGFKTVWSLMQMAAKAF